MCSGPFPPKLHPGKKALTIKVCPPFHLLCPCNNTHPWVEQGGGDWVAGRLYHHMTNE